MKLGLGLRLTNTKRPPSKSSENSVKAALKERQHIRAMRDGVSILIQPYALLKNKGVSAVYGIVVLVDGEARGDWSPSVIDLASVSGVEVYDKTFVPSDAFDAGALDGVVSVVEGFNPFDDADKSTPSEG